MFRFFLEKSRSARVNSNYHPTAFTVLGESHLSISAWKRNYFS